MMQAETLTLTQPDDWHIHLRDDAYLHRTVNDAAKQFARAIVMPNLKPPVVDVEQALAYRQRILAALEPGSNFTPLMTLYLTNQTSAQTIKAAAAHPHVYAVKLYPAGATTHSSAGVSDVKACYPLFEIMQRERLPLLIHGEVTDPSTDLFDREALFIEEVLAPLVSEFPELPIVLEHISTKVAAEFVTAAPNNLAATITAHHLLLNRNDLLAGGVRPHHYCLPVLKRNSCQQALIKAATSGNPKFFLGTDSAPHSQSRKECVQGCAGIYTAHAAIELYAEAFSQADALEKLEDFASHFGPQFYGLEKNTRTITLQKKSWQVSEQLSFADESLIPLYHGQHLQWQIVE